MSRPMGTNEGASAPGQLWVVALPHKTICRGGVQAIAVQCDCTTLESAESAVSHSLSNDTTHIACRRKRKKYERTDKKAVSSEIAGGVYQVLGLMVRLIVKLWPGLRKERSTSFPECLLSDSPVSDALNATIPSLQGLLPGVHRARTACCPSLHSRGKLEYGWCL